MLINSDPPGKPGRPVIEDYDKDRAEIKWTAPKNDGGSPITKYVIEKRPKGGDWEKVCRFFIYLVIFASSIIPILLSSVILSLSFIILEKDSLSRDDSCK